MLNYYDLSLPAQSLLILGLFLEMCVSGCLVPVVMRRRKRYPKLINLFGILLNGILVLLYTAEARARLRNLDVPMVSDRLCNLPILIPVCVFVLVLGSLIGIIAWEYRFRKNTITRSSIKEGVDKLTSGLCFYLSDGRVVLTNRCMQELCFAITGRDLQNAVAFWELLSQGDVGTDVQRLSAGDHPSFRLPDGSVWSFARDSLSNVHQLTAANTTQIQAVMDELKEKNADLAALNLRLRKYGENVDELTRSRERLETKARIHSELGQALLSTRRFLSQQDDTQMVPLEMWQRNIAMLRKEAVLTEDEQPLQMLSRIASATGMSIELTGTPPTEEKLQKLFVQAAAEALTNAMSHAHAKTLFIELRETAFDYSASFKNGGDRPRCEITEGGGLGSLRKKIESEGGTMSVTGMPEFVLTITLPKERSGRI